MTDLDRLMTDERDDYEFEWSYNARAAARNALRAELRPGYRALIQECEQRGLELDAITRLLEQDAAPTELKRAIYDLATEWNARAAIRNEEATNT